MKRVLVVVGIIIFFFGMYLGYYQNQNSQQKVNATSWDQQAYIWQRIWTPQHRLALQQSHDLFSSLRVLGLQLNRGEGIRNIEVDTQLLKQDGRPVWLVARIDGQLSDIDTPLLYENLLNQLQKWRKAGLVVTGVEIDYDSGSSKLVVYQQFLKQLRATLPAELQLSLTVLPAWFNSPDLPALLQQTDLSVLQVHAVLSPEKGLFDTGLALGWIDAYSKLAPKPFYVALPAYGMGLAGYQDQIPLVESETSVRIAGQMQELFVDPQSMADFLLQLGQRSTPNLKGLIWFRLPLESDRRAWSMSTLKAVILQQPLVPEWHIDVQPQPSVTGQVNTLFNLMVRNSGQTDSILPEEIVLPAEKCQIGDAAGSYRLEQDDKQLRFIRVHQQPIRAGQSQAMGWARCTSIDQGEIYVRP